MAYITPNISLTAWDLETDPYNHSELANNWLLIDAHDHSPGKGAQLSPDAFPELGQDNLGTCSVGSNQICDGAVINSKIAINAVQGTNIATSAVSNVKIANNAISTDRIQSDAVVESKISDGSVTTNKLGTNAVTTVKIGNGQVTNPKLANNAVTNDKVGTGAINTDELADLSVTTTKLGPNAVTRPKIGNQAVGTNELGKVPCVYVLINQVQNIPSDDLTPIEWDANRYDTDDMWDQIGDRTFVRIQTSGLYLFTGGVLWGGANDNNGRSARIRKNDTPFCGSGPDAVVAEEGQYQVRQSISGVVNCQVGDKIDIAVKQASGEARHIRPEGILTHLTATWVAPLPD